MDLKKSNFKINNEIRRISSDFQLTTKTHKIVYADKNNLSIYADRERITQVLVNLISNSIKYSPNANKVIIKLLKDKNRVIVSFKDFGIGIPKEHQQKIFDRFFRVKGKTENNISGLGLGLYISSQIIKLHHGSIWVESEVGKGSTFYIS